jgi:lauroyl/myristoyl acyltransferase
MIRSALEAIAVNLLCDRLGERRWVERLTITGTAPEQLAAWGKRPVIAVFLHTGGYGMVRNVLRSRGLPAATLVRGIPRIVTYQGKAIRARSDLRYGLAGVPHFFYLDGTSLRPLLRFLQPGRVVLVALDGERNQEALVRCEVEGGALYLSDGVVRLARASGAMLVPVSVARTGPCRFELRFGEPVPDAVLEENEGREALPFLARALWRDMAADPDGIGWRPLESLAPEQVRARVYGP